MASPRNFFIEMKMTILKAIEVARHFKGSK